MKINEAIKILKSHNQWRRSSQIQQEHPTKIGIAIDLIIIELEKNNNLEEQLINFLIYLNNKGLINNHDFDYENEIKKYLKNN